LKYRDGYLPFEDRLERWIYDNLAAESYAEHPNLHILKYEELIENPERALRDVNEFFQEEFDPAMLEYYKQERKWYSQNIAKPLAIKSIVDHNTNRNWQINHPLFDGRGRWRAEMLPEEM
jgi:hypothetical protein